VVTETKKCSNFFYPEIYGTFIVSIDNHANIERISEKKKLKPKKIENMFGNPSNHINAYKSFQKLRVMIFILLLIVPFTFLLLYFDNFISCSLFNIGSTFSLRNLFDYSWWRIAIFIVLQYVVFTVLGSIFYHTFKVIVKNRDFFLS